jgi:anti-anti-sigma factor
MTSLTSNRETARRETSRQDQAVVITVNGAGDDFAWASRTVEDYVTRGTARNMVIDCTGARCFDCATLGHFLRLSLLVSSHGGQLVLCGLSTLQYEILRLVKLHRRWPVFENRSDAIRALRGGVGQPSAARF